MVNPSKWVNLKSNFLKFHHRNQMISGIEKARKMAYFRAFLALLSCRLSLAELRSATSCFETVFKSSEWRFPLIFQGFSGYSTKIAPPFNHKNGGTLSTHGRGKCGIYNAQKVFGLIILHLRIDVHSCLAVFMPRKILNCLWINASIQKIGNVGMP